MKDQHVDLNEAVHWGTFQLADDPLDLPLHELAGVCRAKGVVQESFFLLPVGGTERLARRLS